MSEQKETVIATIDDWLALPRANLPIIRRCLGLLSLPILLLVWVATKGAGGPYNVPCWRFGSSFLELPLPPEALTNAIFVLAGVASLLLLLGMRSNLAVALLVAVLGYFGSRDLTAFHYSFVTMCFWFLIALLFDVNAERNYSRRLIQLAIFVCYFYSVVQKTLFPDFTGGYSLQAIFQDGWALRSALAAPFIILHLPHSFYLFSAWATVGLELFLAFGLFVRKTRKIALVIGFLFHLVILIVLDDSNFIALYSLFMFTGYLAFLEPKKQTAGTSGDFSGSVKAPVIVRCAAISFIAMMLVLPARILFWSGRPVTNLSFFDRSPSTFAMFLMRQKTQQITVNILDNTGWHDVSLKGRMKDATSDSEIIALANYISKTQPLAQIIKVQSSMLIDDRWLQTKTYTSSVKGSLKENVLTVRIEKNNS